ncbi:MAG: type II secretion system protein GspE, partial [Eubacteriales bacterium]|nr:type II secretion system protein GspE [Eubacteriales bacterium]
SYEPADEELELLGIRRTPGMRFYRGRGCAECYHTGYRGRIGVFEIMVLKREAKRIIAAGRPRAELTAVLERDGFRTMREDCLRLVHDGVTTVSEAVRIVSTTEE